MNTGSVLVDRQPFHQVLCCYQNSTPQIQVVRILDNVTLHLERVIFPAEQFLFEAFPDAKLEIYSQDSSGVILQESKDCSKLQVES